MAVKGGPHGGRFASAGWHCGALLTRWKGGAPLDTTQGMGDTGSNRGDCTRLYGPASNSLAEPISDLLSQVRASERFGGEATDGSGRAGSRARGFLLEKMYWVRGMGSPGTGSKVQVQQRPGGMDAARITAKKIRPACTPSNLLQRPGGRQAGVPRATPRPSPASLIQSAAHSKIRAQAIPLFLLSQFSLSSSPIQNCTALTQTQHLAHSLPALPISHQTQTQPK